MLQQEENELSASPSSANALEVQQEAAIAKIEPAVVELEAETSGGRLTTAGGQQIGSGVIYRREWRQFCDPTQSCRNGRASDSPTRLVCGPPSLGSFSSVSNGKPI